MSKRKNLSSNVSQSIGLSDSTNIINIRSFSGLNGSLSRLSIENETLLSQNSDMSLTKVVGTKSFIERVKQSFNASEISTNFSRVSFNNATFKKRKREINLSCSSLLEPTTELFSNVSETIHNVPKEPLERKCNINMTFSQSYSDKENYSLAGRFESAVHDQISVNRTRILKSHNQKKVSVRFECDSTSSFKDCSLESSKQNRNIFKSNKDIYVGPHSNVNGSLEISEVVPGSKEGKVNDNTKTSEPSIADSGVIFIQTRCSSPRENQFNIKIEGKVINNGNKPDEKEKSGRTLVSNGLMQSNSERPNVKTQEADLMRRESHRRRPRKSIISDEDTPCPSVFNVSLKQSMNSDGFILNGILANTNVTPKHYNSRTFDKLSNLNYSGNEPSSFSIDSLTIEEKNNALRSAHCDRTPLVLGSVSSFHNDQFPMSVSSKLSLPQPNSFVIEDITSEPTLNQQSGTLEEKLFKSDSSEFLNKEVISRIASADDPPTCLEERRVISEDQEYSCRGKSDSKIFKDLSFEAVSTVSYTSEILLAENAPVEDLGHPNKSNCTKITDNGYESYEAHNMKIDMAEMNQRSSEPLITKYTRTSDSCSSNKSCSILRKNDKTSSNGLVKDFLGKDDRSSKHISFVRSESLIRESKDLRSEFEKKLCDTESDNTRKSVTFASVARLRCDSHSREISLVKTPAPEGNRCLHSQSKNLSKTKAVNDIDLKCDALNYHEKNSLNWHRTISYIKEEPEGSEGNTANEHKFQCPEIPLPRSIKHESEGWQNGSGKYFFIKRLSEKTINELSYDIVSDISEIPFDESRIQKKLIYHSTPKHPSLQKRSSMSESGKRSIQKSHKDQMIQVSNSIFGSSSDAISRRKKTNDLSTSYSYQVEGNLKERKNDSSKSESTKKLNPPHENSSCQYPSSFSELGNDYIPSKVVYSSSSDGNKASNEDSSTNKIMRSKNMLSTLSYSQNYSSFQAHEKSSKKIVHFRDFSSHIDSTISSSQRQVLSSYSKSHCSLLHLNSSNCPINSRLETPPNNEASEAKTYFSSVSISNGEAQLTKQFSEVSISTPLLKPFFPFRKEKDSIQKPKKKHDVNTIMKYDYKHDERFRVDNKPYVAPKIKYDKWVHPELVKFIISCLKGHCDSIQWNVAAQKIVSHLCATVSSVSKMDREGDISSATIVLKNLLFRYNICSNVMEYCMFINRFTPFTFQKKVLGLNTKLVLSKLDDPLITDLEKI